MSAGKGSQPRAVNGETFRRNYEAIFGRNHFAAVTEGVAGDSRRERPEPPQLFNPSKLAEFQTALFWCASWLDTLSDHLHGKGLAWEMLGELSRKRRENPALDEAFAIIGWTREAEDNFFKARLVPEGEE
jgi:hypothetical protein